MLFTPLIVLGQAIVLFFGSLLFGKPNLLSFIKVKDTSSNTTNTSIITTNTCTTTCGTCEYVTPISGALYPPEYPSFYTKSYNCIFNIVVPTGKTVNIYFPFGVLQGNDKVTFYDGNSTGSPLVSVFTNQNTASRFAFTSTSNTLTTEFVADVNNGGGSWASYYIVQ